MMNERLRNRYLRAACLAVWELDEIWGRGRHWAWRWRAWKARHLISMYITGLGGDWGTLAHALGCQHTLTLQQWAQNPQNVHYPGDQLFKRWEQQHERRERE